jgi:hypothetical protein
VILDPRRFGFVIADEIKAEGFPQHHRPKEAGYPADDDTDDDAAKGEDHKQRPDLPPRLLSRLGSPLFVTRHQASLTLGRPLSR